MKLLVVCACVLAIHGTAGAENAEHSPREYPLAETDRPLLDYDGMTVLDVSLDLPTYTTTTVDAMGNSTTSTTTLGDHRDPDILLAHSFGGVKGRFQIAGAFLVAGASVRTGDSGAVDVAIEVESPQKDVDHSVAGSAGYLYKALVVPGRLAIYAGGGARGLDRATKSSAGMTSPANLFSVNVAAGAIVQLTSRLGLTVGPRLVVPVTHSDGIDPVTTLGAQTQLLLGFRRWDIYAQFRLGDLTHTPHPFAALGGVYRWGG